MSKLRSVSTGFWSDPFIEELDSEEKLLFLYLITNEKTNMLGIYEASLKKISFETGLSFERVRKALERFETLRKVKYSNNYVFVLNYMKHQKYNSNMKKSAMAVYSELPEHMKIKGFDYDKINPLKGFETLLNHLGMVSKIEIEIEEEIEYEIKEEVEKEKEDEKSLSFSEIKKLEEENWEKTKYEAWNSHERINRIAMNNNISYEDTKQYMRDFGTLCVDRGDTAKTLDEFFTHFVNWLRSEIKNKVKDKSNIVEDARRKQQEIINRNFRNPQRQIGSAND